MIVGYMRLYRHPTYMAKLVSITSKYQGIDVIFLRPRDINMKTGKVKGKMFINNSWIEVETDLPPFIDINQFCFKKKYRETMDYLREHTLLSDNTRLRLNKYKLQSALKEDNSFSHLVIPTLKIKSFEEIGEFLNSFPTVVIKPIGGSFGDNVYILKKEGTNCYIIKFEDKERVITSEELYDFYEENIKDKNYMLQKYIDSRSKQGHPYDCRINVEKNGEGKWVVARKIIRIGIGQKVVSNISKGGGVSNTEPFLRTNFGQMREKIEQELNEIAETLPYKVEKLRKTKLMTLGIDIGIDSSGEVYVFELNSSPGTSQLRSEAALLRAEYYKYVLENVLEIEPELTEAEKLKGEIQTLKAERKLVMKERKSAIKEKEFYKKKYEK